jgi:hypothetical protein
MLLVFSATFNNISVISPLVVDFIGEETEIAREKNALYKSLTNFIA